MKSDGEVCPPFKLEQREPMMMIPPLNIYTVKSNRLLHVRHALPNENNRS